MTFEEIINKSYWYDNHRAIFNKDCRVMSELPDECVQMCVTSPPYWGLRKYSGLPDLIWGGEKDCLHQWVDSSIPKSGGVGDYEVGRVGNTIARMASHEKKESNTCSLCGAWKGAYGLEPNPELYIQHTIEILKEIRRVLRKDGVCFWNCGDSYFGGGNNRGNKSPISDKQASNYGAVGQCAEHQKNIGKHPILKPKDLCLIPFRVAIAAQDPYQEFTIKELADRAWLAGIIDGEGCIGIHHLERDDRGNHYHQFQPFISVGSIDPPLIDRIARITRMNGTRQTTQPGDTDGRGIITRHANYEWRVEGTNAIKVIEDVFPNLTIKRKQAKIVCELAECHAPHTGKGHKVPADITTYKLMLWQMIKDCNQRKDVDVNLPEPAPHIEPGWWVRSVIIWSKPNPMPESVTDRPTESHEYILMLTKNKNYYWDAEAVREPYTEPMNRWGGQVLKTPPGGFDLREDDPYEAMARNRDMRPNPAGRNLRSVWEFPTQPYPEAHFAVFPEKLPEICIKAASKPNDIVLDPFAGSGTTLKVAAELSRRAVGYELSEEYCKLIVDRNRQAILV